MTVLTGTDPRRETEVAVFLMRMPLVLLDRSDELLAAVRLQHAVDSIGVGGVDGRSRERAISPSAPAGTSPSGGA